MSFFRVGVDETDVSSLEATLGSSHRFRSSCVITPPCVYHLSKIDPVKATDIQDLEVGMTGRQHQPADCQHHSVTINMTR